MAWVCPKMEIYWEQKTQSLVEESSVFGYKNRILFYNMTFTQNIRQLLFHGSSLIIKALLKFVLSR